MYPHFLDCGYTSDLFWESSLAEVIDLIQSKRRIEEKKEQRKLEELKARAVMDRNLAAQIVEMIAISLSKDENKTITPLSEYYPALFSNSELEDSEVKKEKDLVLNKEKLKEFAYWHNKRREEAE